MRVTTCFTAAEVEAVDPQGTTAVVIDVIRATTVMLEALANGARAIYPTATMEDAMRLVGSIGRDGALLCGERRGLRIEGFDLGNSPYEFTRDQVEGQQLVMNTTNGTRALVAASDADHVFVAAYVNLGAVAEAVSNLDDLLIVCAGREDRFAIEDALCAGHLIRRIEGASEDAPVLDDAGRAAREIAVRFEPTTEFLERTAAGIALMEVGLGDDLASVARVDSYDLVPEMVEMAVRLRGSEDGLAEP